MKLMRNKMSFFFLAVAIFALAGRGAAQGAKGAVEITARITPTGGRPEPVRQMTFYVLTKSYADIVKETEGQNTIPSREEFIKSLKISDELKEWMKAHDVIDLEQLDVDKLFTPEDIMRVPEFAAAYIRTNSGGVTAGLPTPKFREADKEANPEKYEKLRLEYMNALKKFIQSHPATITGMELELAGVNPKMKWDKLNSEHRRQLAQIGPDAAQGKYLAAKGDTDLEGKLVMSGLAPGNYWVATLGMDATSGDRRLHWDVPVKIEAGQTARLELTNLNAIDSQAGR